jgi:hypothetical protein
MKLMSDFCPTGQPSVSDLLYFGTAKPDGFVSPEDWADFLSSAVTPRYPQGLSAWQASGQWQGADGKLVVREDSFVLSLIHPESSEDEQSIADIVREYKTRFSQEAVMRVKSQACVSF